MGLGIICIDSSPWSIFFSLQLAWCHVNSWCFLSKPAPGSAPCSLCSRQLSGAELARWLLESVLPAHRREFENVASPQGWYSPGLLCIQRGLGCKGPVKCERKHQGSSLDQAPWADMPCPHSFFFHSRSADVQVPGVAGWQERSLGPWIWVGEICQDQEHTVLYCYVNQK